MWRTRFHASTFATATPPPSFTEGALSTVRKLLCRLRPAFAAKLAETAQGKLFAATMMKIDGFFQMPRDIGPTSAAALG